VQPEEACDYDDDNHDADDVENVHWVLRSRHALVPHLTQTICASPITAMPSFRDNNPVRQPWRRWSHGAAPSSQPLKAPDHWNRYRKARNGAGAAATFLRGMTFLQRKYLGIKINLGYRYVENDMAAIKVARARDQVSEIAMRI